MSLTLEPGPFDEWWVLAGAENWACVEGSAEEWAEIADLLASGRNGSVSHKRCAAVVGPMRDSGTDCVHLYSPRNASGERDYVRLSRAAGQELARQIAAVLVGAAWVAS